MDDKTIKQTEETEVDLGRLIQAIIRKAWMVVLVAIVSTAVALVGTLLFVTPQYQSSAKFYVNNGSFNSSTLDKVSSILSAGDINASRGLVDTYIVILNTRETLNAVIDYSGVNISYGQLKGIISAAAVDDTEIFQVTVTHPDPVTAEKLANAIAYILPKRISTIVENTSAKVAEAAVVPSSPSSPSYISNSLLGLAVGLVLAVVAILLQELFDVSVRVEDDIHRVCEKPVLASVPDMLAPSKGGRYYYRYRYGYGQKNKTEGEEQEPVLVGPGISFSASEAYKLLRTKLQYSFTDDKKSHVIGISSALAGEGKSLTSINLAHSLSQLDKKVLLIDCDMRRPSLHDKVPIEKTPGLSGYLTGQHTLEKLTQNCGLPGAEKAFQVIASGQNPPNPIELLSSPKMAKMMESLRETYDYIILDLPPVGEVSDALAVSQIIDGVLMVVRQHYCDRNVLTAAVRQFNFVEGRILGVAFNCTTEESAGYGYYRKYYRKYYKKYGRKYENSYRHASKAVEKQTK